MAACAITISGTSGSVMLRYMIGANKYTTVGYIGDPVFIDDTAVDVTYTTLSGDAIASSICLTITNLPEICYLFEWSYYRNSQTVVSKALPYEIQSLSFDSNTYAITSGSMIFNNLSTIITEINNLGVDDLKVVASKISVVNNEEVTVSFILKTIGASVPTLVLANMLSGNDLIMEGDVSVSCLPVGFDSVI